LPVVAIDDDMPLTGSANATATETETDAASVDTDMPINTAAPLSIDDQPLSGQSNHSNTSASNDATTSSTAAAMTDAFPSTDPAEQPPVTDGTTSSSDSSPLSDRLVSKDWKVRKPAFEELVQVFQTATSKSVFAEYGK
jgi:hypothetical protein